MINSQWLELPMSRTNFHGPKDVRAIEVRLYIVGFVSPNMATNVCKVDGDVCLPLSIKVVHMRGYPENTTKPNIALPRHTEGFNDTERHHRNAL